MSKADSTSITRTTTNANTYQVKACLPTASESLVSSYTVLQLGGKSCPWAAFTIRSSRTTTISLCAVQSSISEMARRWDELDKEARALDTPEPCVDPDRLSAICDEQQDLEYQIMASPARIQNDITVKERFAGIIGRDDGKFGHLVQMIQQLDIERVAAN